jgi:p-cymene monooxygenase electron transfer component
VAPEAAGNREVSFFIRHVPGGAFTDLLFAGGLAGRPLKVHGPAGNFWLRESRAPMICIAGGSGLAPLYAILQDALKRHVGRPCMVLFGARTAADLYVQAELAAIGAAWNGAFSFVPVLSHEPANSGWTGRRGLVTDAIAACVQGFASGDAEAYLCGPPPMIDAALPHLMSLGLKPEYIHCDKFLDGSHGLNRQE